MSTQRYIIAVSLLTLTAAGAGAGLAACTSSPVISKTTETPPAPPAATTPAAAPASSETASAPVTGPLGTSFTVTTTDINGNSTSYTVTATRIDQNAGLTPYETMDNPADHMAAVRFTVTGVTGQASDDANSDATAIAADTTAVQASFSGVTDGGNFSSGEFRVGPGQSESGWVTFEMPAGAQVASVQWAPGLNGSAATWTVGS